jgi:hypothetical protein
MPLQPLHRVACLVAALLACSSPWAHATVVSDMATPPTSSATIKVTITVTTSLGSCTDRDTKTMDTKGTATAVFLPDAPAFTTTQFNAMQISFASATFNFQFFCLPFIGCQNLNVTMNNLSFTLVEPTCSPIAPGTGSIALTNALVHVTGDYSTTGVTVTSGTLDNTAAGSINGRITNPGAGNVKLDQLTMATQTFVADPADLPSPLTGLTITVMPTLTNTTMSGPYSASAESFDADGDGQFDFCDTCTDTDGDGYALMFSIPINSTAMAMAWATPVNRRRHAPPTSRPKAETALSMWMICWS